MATGWRASATIVPRLEHCCEVGTPGAQEHLHLPDGGVPGWGPDKSEEPSAGQGPRLPEQPHGVTQCRGALPGQGSGGGWWIRDFGKREICQEAHWPESTAVRWDQAQVRTARQAVPMEQHWRLGLLSFLLSLRREKHRSQEDTNRVEAMLVFLCTT